MHTHRSVNTRQGRVLLVDDEEVIRKPIVLFLRNAGHDVVEAESSTRQCRSWCWPATLTWSSLCPFAA